MIVSLYTNYTSMMSLLKHDSHKSIIRGILFLGITALFFFFVYTEYINRRIKASLQMKTKVKESKTKFTPVHKSQFRLNIDSKTFSLENIVVVSSILPNNITQDGFQKEYNKGLLTAIKKSKSFILELDPECELNNGSMAGRSPHLPHPYLFSHLLKNIKDHKFGLRSVSKSDKFLNPYSVFGPDSFIWPRGIPLDVTEHSQVHFPELIELSDRVPDRTVVFQSSISNAADTVNGNINVTWKTVPISHVVVDNSVMVPYNRLATVHSNKVFWSLYLPVTVTYKMAAIWRAYISQAIFKIVGYYVVFTPPMVTRRVQMNRDDFGNKADDENLHKLVDVLNKWVDKNKNPPKCNISNLFTSIYSNLVQHKLLGVKELKNVCAWIFQLEKINYDFSCKVVSINFSSSSSQKHRKPFNIFGAISMSKEYAQNIGFVHAYYSGVYKKLRIYVGRTKKDDPCISPLPQKTICIEARGSEAYAAYLLALDGLKGDYEREIDVPSTLVWQHDDMLINFTKIHDFLRDEKVYFGAMPIYCNQEDYQDVKGNWSLLTETKTEQFLKSDDYEPQKDCPHLVIARPILQQLLKDATKMRSKFFNESGSECHEVLKHRNYSISDVSRLTTKMLSDMIMTKWRHPKLENFHKRLKILADNYIFLEYAIPLAFRCSLSAADIDKNFSLLKFCETSYWDGRRNDATTLQSRISHASQSLYHPFKIVYSPQHLDAALKWKSTTLSHVNLE